MTARMNESALGVLVQCDETRKALRETPGQLWERLAEGFFRGEVYPGRLAAQRWRNLAETGANRLDVELRRGKGWHRRFTNDNGVIRAGVRIK